MSEEAAVYKVSGDQGRPKVTIHAKACEAAGLEPGDHVLVHVDDGELRLERVEGDVRRVGGTLIIGEAVVSS